MEVFNEKDEEVKDRLLRLIEEGDPTVILSSEYRESLNELIKFEFVSIENDALRLTEKGKEAKILGTNRLIKQSVTVEKEIKISDFPQQKVTPKISNRSFLILLFFFLVSLLAMISLINS